MSGEISQEQPVDYRVIVDSSTRVLAFGEMHLDRLVKLEVKRSLSILKEMGFTHLGLEFFDVSMQDQLNRYKPKQSYENLAEYLRRRWWLHPSCRIVCSWNRA